MYALKGCKPTREKSQFIEIFGFNDYATVPEYTGYVPNNTIVITT
jgi:hypothetical protein